VLLFWSCLEAELGTLPEVELGILNGPIIGYDLSG
jgi:hypothetical protein